LAGLPNETWWVLGGMYLGVKTPIPTLPLCCILCCNQSPGAAMGAAGSYIMFTCILQILANDTLFKTPQSDTPKVTTFYTMLHIKL